MQRLAAEIGERNAQAYLARAYRPSLNTDLHPREAAEKLLKFAAILKNDVYIAALSQVLNEVPADAPFTPEQNAMIVQNLARHIDDGTHYASAGQFLAALEGYIAVIETDFGGIISVAREGETVAMNGVEFVRSKYILGISDTKTAIYLEIYLDNVS